MKKLGDFYHEFDVNHASYEGLLTVHDDSHGSYHYPLTININTSAQTLLSQTTPTSSFNFNKANWEAYKSELLNIDINQTLCVITKLNHFVTKAIINAAYNRIPKKTISNRKKVPMKSST